MITTTAGVMILWIVVSVGLVVHKEIARRRATKVLELMFEFSGLLSAFLSEPIPPRRPGSTAKQHFANLDAALRPLRDRLDMDRGRRPLSREVIRTVFVDFMKDLEGDPIERLVYASYALGIVDDVIREMDDRSWWVRAEAARDLGLLRVRRGITVLTAAIEDPHPVVQFQAVRSLFTLSGPVAVSTLFRLGDRLTQWQMIELSADVLACGEEVVPYLIEGLSVDKPSFAIFAIEMLAEIGFVQAVDPLKELADQTTVPAVRAKAIEALGRLGDERAQSQIIDRLRDDEACVRLAALHALARLGAPGAVSDLVSVTAGGSEEEVFAAAHALAGAGDAGREALRGLVGQQPAIVSEAAAEALEIPGAGGGGRP